MTPKALLSNLLDRVSAAQDNVVLINEHELNQWPAKAVVAMKSQRLIVKAKLAASAVCPGCERGCVMPVHTVVNQLERSNSFIVCDKRDDINRVLVMAEQLVQWRCSIDLVCQFIGESLQLSRSTKTDSLNHRWEVGIARGNKRRQMLCLQAGKGLFLVVGESSMPLVELLDFNESHYLLDHEVIKQLVDSATTAESRYTPSQAQREVRRLNTQDMYKAWKDKYRQLKKSDPTKSATWYASRIAKLDIAQGRSAETIRKNMV